MIKKFIFSDIVTRRKGYWRKSPIYWIIRSLIQIFDGILSLFLAPFGLDINLNMNFIEYTLLTDMERYNKKALKIKEIFSKYEIPSNRKYPSVFNVQWFLRQNIVKTPEEIEILTNWLKSQSSED